MKIYKTEEVVNNNDIKSEKEILKRKESLLKFRKEVQKQVKINSKRKQMSIEYSKKYISD